MLYTILDENEVFLENCRRKYFYKKVDNCVLEGVKYNQDVILNRIISTNLNDYLNPNYQIGSKLKF
jgi:hypothetical protein